MDTFRYFLMFLIFMISCPQYEAALADGEYIVGKRTTARCYICEDSEWKEENCTPVTCIGRLEEQCTMFYPKGGNRNITTTRITKQELLDGCKRMMWVEHTIGGSHKYTATWIMDTLNQTVHLNNL